jgi:hypothetical protein
VVIDVDDDDNDDARGKHKGDSRSKREVHSSQAKRIGVGGRIR